MCSRVFDFDKLVLLQVTSIGGLKYSLPRGFNPMGRPTFHTRGNSRAPIAGRGKKTQMKVNLSLLPRHRLVSAGLRKACDGRRFLSVFFFFQATGKKKTTIKKTKEVEKKDSRGHGVTVDGITDYK